MGTKLVIDCRTGQVQSVAQTAGEIAAAQVDPTPDPQRANDIATVQAAAIATPALAALLRLIRP